MSEELTVFEKESIKKFLGLDDNALAKVQEASAIGPAVNINMTIPMICKGNKCSISDLCYLHNNGETEKIVGKRCPIEIAAVNSLFNSYIDSLKVDVNNLVDVGLVRDLVDIDIRIRRTSAAYAKDGKLDYASMVGVDDNNNAIWEKKEMPHVSVFNKLLKEKERILRMLHATRDQKEDKKTKMVDPSTLAAKIIEEANKRDRIKKEKIIEVDNKEVDNKEVDNNAYTS